MFELDSIIEKLRREFRGEKKAVSSSSGNKRVEITESSGESTHQKTLFLNIEDYGRLGESVRFTITEDSKTGIFTITRGHFAGRGTATEFKGNSLEEILPDLNYPFLTELLFEEVTTFDVTPPRRSLSSSPRKASSAAGAGGGGRPRGADFRFVGRTALP